MKSLSEIRKRGWETLVKELGVKDATRFVMEYEPGSGDYTKTRKKLFRGKSVNDIVRDMKKKK